MRNRAHLLRRRGIEARPAAVLLDLDGVLLDSMPWHVKAWQEAFAEIGFDIDDEFLYLHEGAIERSRLFATLAARELIVDNEAMVRLFSRQGEIFLLSYADKVKPYPDAEAGLRQLAEAGLRLALVTSSPRLLVNHLLPGGMLGRFETMVTGDMVRRGKPDPEPYLKALAALDLPAPTVRAVENAPAGICSAHEAGLVCFALMTTLSAGQLIEADALFSSLAELADFLTKDASLTQ